MSPNARRSEKPPDKPRRTRKGATQRSRLIRSMVELVAGGGYSSATVAAVTAKAQVSKPTFYEYFADRDECFSAAISEIQAQLNSAVHDQVSDSPPADALRSVVRALVGFATAHPIPARFLMSEALGGGAPALELRDAGVAEIAEIVEAALRQADQVLAAPDLEAKVLVGGIYRLLASRLRRRELALSWVVSELDPWLDSYSRPLSAHRWRNPGAASSIPRSPHVPIEPIQRMPGALPRGRPRISEEVSENHRLRILYAAARMAEDKGYLATTVADIVKLAGLDAPSFYRLFAHKQEAFLAVHELGFLQVMDITSKAFFSAPNWPERSWEAGRALIGLLEDNPLVAHVGFVEAYAVGPAAVQRVDDTHVAFMFFLQEGLLSRDHEPAPTPLAMEAMITCVFEVIYAQARSGRPQVSSALPPIAHVWLTPFLGIDGADRFIDDHVPAVRAQAKAPKRQKPAARARKGR
jgi:AcrR family transcriptional regulator